MRHDLLRFFVFGTLVIIGYGVDWFDGTAAILLMISFGFLSVIILLRDILKKL